jgi:hypothetical protein
VASLAINVVHHQYEVYDINAPTVWTLISVRHAKLETIIMAHTSFSKSGFPYHLLPILEMPYYQYFTLEKILKVPALI